jgi:hypothetical protein
VEAAVAREPRRPSVRRDPLAHAFGPHLDDLGETCGGPEAAELVAHLVFDRLK